jgi:LysM repeat protein
VKRFLSSFALIMVAALATGCASTPATPAEQPAAEASGVKPAAPIASTSTTAAATSGVTSYNVVRGDHLWGISAKPSIYGNPYEWPLIFKANRDKIKDADLIEVGQILSINKNPSKADIDAAVYHAKTRGAWQLGTTEKSDMDYLSGQPVRTSRN